MEKTELELVEQLESQVAEMRVLVEKTSKRSKRLSRSSARDIKDTLKEFRTCSMEAEKNM
jgi:hypothetical protein